MDTDLEAFFELCSLGSNNGPVFVNDARQPVVPHECVSVGLHLSGGEACVLYEEHKRRLRTHEFPFQSVHRFRLDFLDERFQLHHLLRIDRRFQGLLCNLLELVTQPV